MDLERLEQYLDKTHEIHLLEERIKEIKAQAAEIVADSVKDGSQWPYVPRTTIIRGLDEKQTKKLHQVQNTLFVRKMALHAQLAEIETFISHISDSQIRQIIELRYIKGLPWNAVAKRLYGYPCGDRARMRVKRYLKKF